MTDQPQQDENPPISTEMIDHALRVLGLHFTDTEIEQAGRTINERLKVYEAMYEMPLDNGVAMALTFDPTVPGEAPVDNTPRRINLAPQPELTRPDGLEEAAFYPVTHLAELLRTRQVTSRELTEMYLTRLKRYDPILHCVVTLTEDLAYQQAERADSEIAAGNYRGPLHGVPWGAKDLLATRGYPTTWGAMPFKEQMLDYDATVVQRLEAAGAVLVAKLTLGALAYGDIWFGGTTKNPWDTSEGSSGSSAGPGAATAAGLVGFSIGTETLGSIVSPATRCGVTGLRPTFGRVSRHGAMALSWSMDKIGPMCRTVEDCAVVFNAIYGPDGMDTTIVDRPFTWQPGRDLKTLRIGYVPDAFEAESATDNDRAVLDMLRGLGIDLIPVELPDYNMDVLRLTLFAEAAAAFDELTRHNLDDLMQWQDEPAWPNTFRAARLIPAVAYIQANRHRMVVMQQMAEVMQSVDVFVTPSFGGDALTLTNLTGHPTVVLPHGFSEKGTPTSISFIGGLYQEAETLAVARAYQQATDFHLQYPGLDDAETTP